MASKTGRSFDFFRFLVSAIAGQIIAEGKMIAECGMQKPARSKGEIDRGLQKPARSKGEIDRGLQKPARSKGDMENAAERTTPSAKRGHPSFVRRGGRTE